MIYSRQSKGYSQTERFKHFIGLLLLHSVPNSAITQFTEQHNEFAGLSTENRYYLTNWYN